MTPPYSESPCTCSRRRWLSPSFRTHALLASWVLSAFNIRPARCAKVGADTPLESLHRSIYSSAAHQHRMDAFLTSGCTQNSAHNASHTIQRTHHSLHNTAYTMQRTHHSSPTASRPPHLTHSHHLTPSSTSIRAVPSGFHLRSSGHGGTQSMPPSTLLSRGECCGATVPQRNREVGRRGQGPDRLHPRPPWFFQPHPEHSPFRVRAGILHRPTGAGGEHHVCRWPLPVVVRCLGLRRMPTRCLQEVFLGDVVVSNGDAVGVSNGAAVGVSNGDAVGL